MKYIIFFVLLFSSLCYSKSYMLLPIDSVYDGDTIKTHISVSRLPPPLNENLKVRILGIDTPEMAAASYYTKNSGKLGLAKCDKEAKLAMEAKLAVIKIIGDRKTMKLTNYDWGSYPRRIVADVRINGHDIGPFLIQNNYAVYDDGKSSKDNKDWCQ